MLAVGTDEPSPSEGKEVLREAESNGRLKVMSLSRCLFSIPLLHLIAKIEFLQIFCYICMGIIVRDMIKT